MTAGTLMLSSCTKPEKKDQTEPTTATENTTSETVPGNLKLEFSGTDNFTIKNAKLKVSLYGVDENLADAPATLIAEHEYEQKSVPFIDFPVPVDAESKINPKPTHGVKYYIATEWDSDGNGKEKDIFMITIKNFLM
jgi:uncharacterized lipoprotein YbaY